jgi:hypothetical protein
MTEEIASTPSWVEKRLDDVFAVLPPSAGPAREAYSACLGRRKAPAAPSDMLGAEFNGCRPALHQALAGLGLAADTLAQLDRQLEALEAEIAEDS